MEPAWFGGPTLDGLHAAVLDFECCSGEGCTSASHPMCDSVDGVGEEGSRQRQSGACVCTPDSVPILKKPLIRFT